MKESGAFRTIGELSKELKIKPHILRYWEDQFAMLQPLKRAGARRHYRPEDVDMVKTINRLLNDEGYTIKGARKYLTTNKRSKPDEAANSASGPPPSVAPAMAMSPAPDEDKSLIIEELRTIRDRLSRALNDA